MHVLVLGGTRFIGRHIVETLVASGHRVSVFARGTSPDPLPASVERLRGNRNDGVSGIAALADREWHACIDVSGYTPSQVRPCVEQLSPRIGRYVFVSTVSVYQLSPDGPLVETDPLLPEAPESVVEVTGETYGPLKVTCERIVRTTYDERATILRPQIVAGPFDPSGRHTYWVQRAMQPGDIAAPGSGADHVQVVDARDIARFTLMVVERNISGIYNMAGPRMTWASFMDMLGVQRPVWVPADAIRASGVGIADLPLFIEDGSEYSAFMNVAATRAEAAGFEASASATTIADTRAWLRACPVKASLSAEREQILLAAAGARG